MVVLKASGALTVGQHDHISELLKRLQRIEAAVTHGQGSGSARRAEPTADTASQPKAGGTLRSGAERGGGDPSESRSAARPGGCAPATGGF